MSKKNCDSKGRFRGRIIGFRVSEEELQLLNSKVKLSGLNKQDYLVKNMMNEQFIVQPNPKVYKALKGKIEEMIDLLINVKNDGKLSDEQIMIIKSIVDIYEKIDGKEK